VETIGTGNVEGEIEGFLATVEAKIEAGESDVRAHLVVAEATDVVVSNGRPSQASDPTFCYDIWNLCPKHFRMIEAVIPTTRYGRKS